VSNGASGTVRARGANASAAPAPALVRELGRWDLTAIGVNQVVGGSIFAMPAALAASVGAWSPLLVLAIGLASMLIAVTFAEVSSRFDATGGPYLFTRAAFGRFLSFEVGWMQWFTRVASWAAVINVLVASLAFYWPAASTEPDRSMLMAVVISSLAVINILGIRQSAWVVNTLTIGKLVPLVLFVAFALPLVSVAQVQPGSPPPFAEISTSALLLIFGYGGYEVVPIPAGESRNPHRDVPFALVMTLVIVTSLFALVQLGCLAALPGLATSKTPLIDAAGRVAGIAGAAVITLGAVISTTGNNMGQALSGSRALFALAEQGDVPRPFARVSRRYRTPVVAIVVTASVSLLLATTGSFTIMAAASAVSRLFVCGTTCAAALRLRDPAFDGRVSPPRFRLPLGPTIPVAAIAIASAILFGATRVQLIVGASALAAGAVLFLIAVFPGRRR
jgi:APA family basic amino acid/polyamine antiporter